MDNIRKVHFRNVGRSYFPQTRVECHYKLTSDHTWANHDWVGLFKVTHPCYKSCSKDNISSEDA